MTPKQLYIYSDEVNMHTQLALDSYKEFRGIVDNPMTRQNRNAWRFFQGFLSHFGMVSKFLFAPTGNPRSKKRAEELSKYLGTNTINSLSNRDARNSIEHLDERMDNWLDPGEKNILEMIYESEQDYSFLSLDKWFVRRVFILSESLFIVEKEKGPVKVEIRPLVDGLIKLNILCHEKINKDKTYYIFPKDVF